MGLILLTERHAELQVMVPKMQLPAIHAPWCALPSGSHSEKFGARALKSRNIAASH
jgi:hypothetical protein